MAQNSEEQYSSRDLVKSLAKDIVPEKRREEILKAKDSGPIIVIDPPYEGNTHQSDKTILFVPKTPYKLGKKHSDRNYQYQKSCTKAEENDESSDETLINQLHLEHPEKEEKYRDSTQNCSFFGYWETDAM